MKKIYKNIIRAFTLIFLYVFLCINISYAAQNGIKKGGYNIFPSQGPIVDVEKRSGLQIVDKSVKNIDAPTAEISVLKNNLRVSQQYDEIVFGRYEQDNNLDNGKEPIVWQVISKEDDGRVMLISKYILDCRKFNTYPAPVTWERCTLREWLNNDFYNAAFNDIEKQYVVDAMNPNKKNFYYNTDSGNPTLDKVFCMSIEEAILYFEDGDDYFEKQKNCLNPNEKRKCMPTPYAIDQGVRVSKHEGISHNCANYWLRTLGKNEEREWYSGITAKYFAAIVQEPGYIKLMGTAVHSSDDGVRPCIYLNSN